MSTQLQCPIHGSIRRGLQTYGGTFTKHILYTILTYPVHKCTYIQYVATLTNPQNPLPKKEQSYKGIHQSITKPSFLHIHSLILTKKLASNLNLTITVSKIPAHNSRLLTTTNDPTTIKLELVHTGISTRRLTVPMRSRWGSSLGLGPGLYVLGMVTVKGLAVKARIRMRLWLQLCLRWRMRVIGDGGVVGLGVVCLGAGHGLGYGLVVGRLLAGSC